MCASPRSPQEQPKNATVCIARSALIGSEFLRCLTRRARWLICEYMSRSSHVAERTPRLRVAQQACKILASSTRYRILRELSAARSARREMCVGEIAEAVGLSQSAISHQLALLEAYGVVAGERMGQTTCYDFTSSPLTKDIERTIRIFE